MMKERDSQRSKVYAAERNLEARHREADRLNEMPELTAYIKKVFSSVYLLKKYKRVRLPRILDGRRCRSASGSASELTFPRWSRCKLIVLHEIAHTLTQQNFGYSVAGHGWQWCSIYLDLVRHFMGKADHDELKAAFREHKVRIRPKKSRPSGEKRPMPTAAIEGLKRYRENRKLSARIETVNRLESVGFKITEVTLNGVPVQFRDESVPNIFDME